MRTPRSTYRLQITAGCSLDRAAEQVGYLHRLGADWVYCSPLLQAEAGSDHGYDVVDHDRTDAARGGRDGLRRLADAAHGAGMGMLIDLVPNHVGIATPEQSVWWWDVLTHGRDSVHARAFDIDWDAGHGRVRVPVLGDGDGDPDRELDALRVVDGRLHYYEHALPIAPGTAGGTAREVHDRQHYELVHFRRADSELNYRRFFAVNTLAGVRVEIPAVFAASHTEIRRWVEEGLADGFRVDHPDGLADPAGYLRDLAELSGGRYTVVEKILEPGEDLPADWRCAGTTGYDTLGLIDRVLVDPAGQTDLDRLDSRLRGGPVDWRELTRETKRAVADGILHSEVRRLVRTLTAAGAAAGRRASAAAGSGTSAAAGAQPGPVPDAQLADAIAEIIALLPVYRTYLPRHGAPLDAAVDDARSRRPELSAAIDAIAAAARVAGSEFATRLEQTSGAVMAKGVEDCAFYRYPRLASLTEVGGDPSIFAVAPNDFHAAQQRRLADWPDGMTTLSTHDTKRGEDVRARIDVLSEVAGDWAESVLSWVGDIDFPDPVLANLLFQTALGAWPIERDRLHGYAEKAAREAGDSTGWIDPDAEFEARLHDLVDACYDHPVIAPALAAWAGRLRPHGWSNSLSAKLIQLTLPGAPDVYRGTELWENSLVDPDNRRPFDPLAPGGAAEMLDRIDAGWLPPIDDTGAAKLLVTSRALRARRDRPELFTGYTPLTADGPAADHLVAFDRGGAITLATRWPLGLAARDGWGDTIVQLPAGRWTDLLTGRAMPLEPAPTDRDDGPTVPDGDVGIVRLADAFAHYPVALLLRAN